MAPAPIAITVRSAAISVLRPSAAIIEEESENIPMIPAVVVIATVEDPCAVFRIEEMRKGKKMPTEARNAAMRTHFTKLNNITETTPELQEGHIIYYFTLK